MAWTGWRPCRRRSRCPRACSGAPAAPGIRGLRPAGRPGPADPRATGGTRMTAAFRGTAEGPYLVTWQVIADDTHPSRGQLSFSVGRATGAPAGRALGGDIGAVSPAGLLLQGLARWLHFLALALGVGTVAFRVLV